MTKSTYQFIESIFIKKEEPLNLEWHQKRVNATFKKFFPKQNPVSLFEVFENIQTPSQENLIKCRITYGIQVQNVELLPFKPHNINTLKIVHSKDFDYSFKYFDRQIIEDLREKKGNCDDILISIKGYLKDTSFANIVLFDNNNYYTPDPPLLYGTKRAKLINNKIIKPIPIKETDLHNFKELHLINALADLGEYIVKIKNIF